MTNINIGSVNSDRNFPVSAFGDDDVTISEGVSLHVHQFGKSTVPGSCIHDDQHLLVCKSCGYTTVDSDAQTTFSDCSPADLIKHEATEPTETEYGNVEYYECPFCRTLYSDADAKNVVDTEPVLFPLGMAPMLELCDEADVLAAPGNPLDDVLDFIFNLADIGISTYSDFADTKFGAYMLAEQKIETISDKLAVISDQLTRMIMDAPTGRKLARSCTSTDRNWSMTGVSGDLIISTVGCAVTRRMPVLTTMMTRRSIPAIRC